LLLIIIILSIIIIIIIIILVGRVADTGRNRSRGSWRYSSWSAGAGNGDPAAVQFYSRYLQLSSLSSVVLLEESPCPRGSSRTNLQVLVLVLGPHSPQRLSRTPHSANSLLRIITLSPKIRLPPPCMRSRWRMAYLVISYITISLSLRKVLVLEDPRGSIYKFLSLSLDHKSLSLSLNIKSWQHHCHYHQKCNGTSCIFVFVIHHAKTVKSIANKHCSDTMDY